MPPLLNDDDSLTMQTASETLPDRDHVACNFLMGTFIWYDILSCASIHSVPDLSGNHDYLSTHLIRLDKIMGCENWVMVLISRISALANWKYSQQSRGCLTLRELLDRGSSIEVELKQGLEKNKTDIGRPVHHPESASCQGLGVPSSKSNLVITRIFAFAALTYLHTVTSGAHPSLPQIKESVASTIETFHSMPNPTVLLRNLVWPFCVTGSMAGKEHEAFFRKAMEIVEREGEWHPGNLKIGWDVVQKCWQMREVEGDAAVDGVDWSDAMEKLGLRILLV